MLNFDPQNTLHISLRTVHFKGGMAAKMMEAWPIVKIVHDQYYQFLQKRAGVSHLILALIATNY